MYSWAKGGLKQRLREASQASCSTVSLRVEALSGHVTRLDLVSPLHVPNGMRLFCCWVEKGTLCKEAPFMWLLDVDVCRNHGEIA